MRSVFKEAIEQVIIAVITAQTDAGNIVTLVGAGDGGGDVDISYGSTISAVELLETHGRIAMDLTVGGTTY